MNSRSLMLLCCVVIAPAAALAAPPASAGVRGEVARLTQLVNAIQADLVATRTELAATNAELERVKANTVLQLDRRISLTRDDHGNETVLLTGANLQIVNGAGATDATNGLGNLIVGYNTNAAAASPRHGSHNIILGDDQSYPSTQEVVTEKIFSSRHLQITAANAMTTTVGATQQTTVGTDQLVTVGANRTHAVGGNHTQTVGGSRSVSVGANQSVTIGANLNENVGGNAVVSVGEEAVVDAGKNLTVATGKNIVVVADDEIAIKTGAASSVLKKNGDVAINGKNISIKASGDLVLKGSRILEN